MLKRLLTLFREAGAGDPADTWDPPPPPPFGLVAEALPAVQELAAAGRGIELRTTPNPARPGERLVAIAVVPAAAASSGDDGTPAPERGAPGEEPLPIYVDEDDRRRLAGAVLDHDPDEGWRLRVSLELRARETPNPDGRLYLVDRRLTDGAALTFTPRTENPALAERLLDHPGLIAVLLRGATLTVERREGTPWSEIDPHVSQALRAHFLAAGEALEGVAEVRFETELENEVARVLDAEVRPAIRRDGGELRLLGVRPDGIAEVRLVGACRSCPSSTRTLHRGVQTVLTRAFPGEVRGVEAIGD